jgi:hypothetical protein
MVEESTCLAKIKRAYTLLFGETAKKVELERKKA